MQRSVLAAAILLLATGCSEETKKTGPGAGGTGTGSGGGGEPVEDGVKLTVDVPASGRVFVRLSDVSVVTPPDDGASSSDWDLAFSGYDVLTNSGIDGPGEGGGVPLDPETWAEGSAPSNVYIQEDEPGGAFVEWWKYDPAEHVIWSRYHVYAVKKDDRYWKVQIFTFYGEVQGAPVSALYQFRYAEVSASGPGPTTVLEDMDATAGGREAPETEPSTCLVLATGQQVKLTPAEARASRDWDLCFRREVVSVNGELGGPGNVSAADLDAAKTDAEELEALKMRTATTEAPHFDEIGFAELTAPSVAYRGDHIVTAFSNRWLAPGSSPPSPADLAWLVQGADGVSRYLVVFDGFEGASETSPGRLTMRVKPAE